ncbi:MAG: hypoxanthine phosphoribosyltransferase [Anaerolineales bacterium]
MARKEILYSRYEIRDRIRIMAKDIAYDYRGQKIQMIAVVNGAVMVAADLMRTLWDLGFMDIEFDTVKVSSYGQNFQSSGQPDIIKDIRLDIRDQHVLIVEDIVDTGLTLNAMREYLLEKGPASLEIVALVRKPLSVRKIDINVKYLGFEIEDVWVEGYGIDSAEQGRANPNIMQVIQDG